MYYIYDSLNSCISRN